MFGKNRGTYEQDTTHGNAVPGNGGYVQEVSSEMGLKMSALIGRALEADRERRTEDLLREGYEEMAAHDLEIDRKFESMDRETPLPEYAEKQLTRQPRTGMGDAPAFSVPAIEPPASE